MMRMTSVAMVVVAAVMSPMIGLAQSTAAPAAGSDVPPAPAPVTAPAPVRASIDLPSKLVVQFEGKQTSGETDSKALVLALVALAGALAGTFVTWRMNAHIADKTRQMNESIADKTRQMNESIADKTGEMNKDIARETGDMNARLAERIEDLKKGLEFRLSSDRTVLEKRMHHYERLLAVLQNFPKYPEPRPLRVAELKLIATMLQGLYFDGAGIYMSKKVRDGYFDLQDGIRIVLNKAGQITPPLEIPQEGEVNLCEVLGRSAKWKPPAEITRLRAAENIKEDEDVPSEVREDIRKLGSKLRTRMAADLDSRRKLSDRGAQPPGNARTRSG